MALWWVAKCKNKQCGELSAVRPSTSGGRHLEIPSASRITKVRCKHCGAENEFHDRDMFEANVDLKEERPEI
jgi:hypothetical protein